MDIIETKTTKGFIGLCLFKLLKINNAINGMDGMSFNKILAFTAIKLNVVLQIN